MLPLKSANPGEKVYVCTRPFPFASSPQGHTLHPRGIQCLSMTPTGIGHHWHMFCDIRVLEIQRVYRMAQVNAESESEVSCSFLNLGGAALFHVLK